MEGGRLGAHSARCLGPPTKGHLEAKLQDKGGDTNVQEGPSAVRVSERCGNTAANEERQEAGHPRGACIRTCDARARRAAHGRNGQSPSQGQIIGRWTGGREGALTVISKFPSRRCEASSNNELLDPSDKIVSFRFLNGFILKEASAVKFEMCWILMKKGNAMIRGVIFKIFSCFWIRKDPE